MADVGADGTGLFSDDLACDVRADYRALLEQAVPDVEVTDRLLVEHGPLDADEEPVFWLALAACQWKAGRLEPRVRDRALQVIDLGEDLRRWQDAGPRALEDRGAVLDRVRAELTSPQPARRTVRRPWREHSELAPGTVLSCSPSSGGTVLFRVARLETSGGGAAPVLQRLDWRLDREPRATELAHLDLVLDSGAQGPVTDALVTRARKRDPDWSDVGFRVLAATPPRPSDPDVAWRVGLTWVSLAEHLGSARGRLGPQT